MTRVAILLIIRCFSIAQHCCLLLGRESVVIISTPRVTRTELPCLQNIFVNKIRQNGIHVSEVEQMLACKVHLLLIVFLES